MKTTIKKFLICTLILLNNLPALSQEDAGIIYDESLNNEGYKQVAPTLKGKVVVAPVGSRLTASLATPISSETSNIGDPVLATVSFPLVVGSDVLIPAGSQLIGQVIDVKSARMFMAGAGGELSIRFTSVQAPNGQRFPLSAVVDTTQFKLQAETGESRTAKVVGKTAVGAGIGALGGLVGAAIGGGEHKGRAAAIGTAIGGGIGAAKALADKGKELVIPSGTQIPVQLDQSLQAVVQPPSP